MLDKDLSFPEAVRMGAMIEPPLGVPDMPPLLEALAGLGRDIQGIIEHDLYPCAPDLPLPIAKRTRTYLALRAARRRRSTSGSRLDELRPRGSPCSGVGTDGRLPRGRAEPGGSGARGSTVVNDFFADKAERGGRTGSGPGWWPTRSRRSTTPRSTPC